MSILPLVRRSAVAMTMLGILTPQFALGAMPDAAAGPAALRRPVADAALHDGGVLQGQVVDPQGLPLAGEKVWIVQDGEVVTFAHTDQDGRFLVQGLRGGIYAIVAAGGGGVYRLWAPNTAPPAAKQATLIVSGQPSVRAQAYRPIWVDGLPAWRGFLIGLAAGMGAGALTYMVLDENPPGS